MTGPDARPGDGFMLGVDLGTSHTVAMLRWPDGRTRPVLFDGQPLLPSAGYLDTTGRLHVGRDALRLGFAEPGRFEPNPKRRVDDQTVLLGGAEVPVAHLLAALLGAVARETVAIAGFLAPAVLTYPASWGEPRREVLVEAIAKSGWPRATRLLPEPVAAARYFADVLRRPVPVGSALAVFDFGGGTLDVAVVRNEGFASDGRPRYVVAASGGADDLGGLDLDAALVDHLGKSLAGAEPQAWQALTEPVTLAQWRARRQFWEDVRGAKEMLSRVAFAPVTVPGVEHAVQLTREELEAAAGPLIRRGVAEAAAVISAAGLTPGELAGLFLVGGSSRVPLVARLLHSELGISPTVLEQPELPVAEGAIVAVTGSAAPAVTGSAAPTVSGSAARAVSGSAAPIVSGTAAPAVSGSAAPAASGSAAGVVSGGAAPAVSGGAAPAVSGSGAPAVSGSAAGVVSGSAAPAVTASAAPAASGSVAPAVSGGVAPAVSGSAAPAVSASAAPAASGSVAPALSGGAAPAAQRGVGQQAAVAVGPVTADLPATEAGAALTGVEATPGDSDPPSTDMSSSAAGSDGPDRPPAVAGAAAAAAQTSPAPAGGRATDPVSGSPAPGPVPPVGAPGRVLPAVPPGGLSVPAGQAAVASGPGGARTEWPGPWPEQPAGRSLPPTADRLPSKPSNAPTSPAPRYAEPVDPWATGEASAFGAVPGPGEPWLASTQPDPEGDFGDGSGVSGGVGPAYKKRVFWLVSVAVVVVLGVATTLAVIFWPKYPALDFHPLSGAMSVNPAGPMGSSFAAAAVRGDRAYFASAEDSTDGKQRLGVVAADTGSGKQVWAKAAVAVADRWEQFVVTPDAVVAFSARDSTTDTRQMVLLDPKNGDLLWTKAIGADDNIMFSGDVAVQVDLVNNQLVGLEVRNKGERRWAHPTPASSSGIRTVAVIRSTTVEDDAGPAATDGTAFTAPLDDDTRIVQIGADRSAQVIDAATGKVLTTINGVADPDDEVVAHNGRLIVAESDTVRRIVEYDLARSGLPKVLYTAPSEAARFKNLTACGPDRVCFVTTTDYDEKTAQIMAVDAAKGGMVWHSALAGVQSLVPVGDSVLARQDSPVAQVSLFDGAGKLAWTRSGEVARLDAGNVLLFSKDLTSGLSDPSLSGRHLGDEEKQLGPLKDVQSSTCAWDTAVIACAAEKDFQIQKFAG